MWEHSGPMSHRPILTSFSMLSLASFNLKSQGGSIQHVCDLITLRSQDLGGPNSISSQACKGHGIWSCLVEVVQKPFQCETHSLTTGMSKYHLNRSWCFVIGWNWQVKEHVSQLRGIMTVDAAWVLDAKLQSHRKVLRSFGFSSFHCESSTTAWQGTLPTTRWPCWPCWLCWLCWPCWPCGPWSYVHILCGTNRGSRGNCGKCGGADYKVSGAFIGGGGLLRAPSSPVPPVRWPPSVPTPATVHARMVVRHLRPVSQCLWDLRLNMKNIWLHFKIFGKHMKNSKFKAQLLFHFYRCKCYNFLKTRQFQPAKIC